LRAIRDMFGQLPNTLEDAWVAVALHDERKARQMIDQAPPAHPFEMRRSECRGVPDARDHRRF